MTFNFGVTRRVLRADDPRGDDYRNAEAWVRDIRSRLAHIRGELEDIGRIESWLEHDRLCNDAAGTVTLLLIALHSLLEGERAFHVRAASLDALWADVESNPANYVIEAGESWPWKPRGIYKRGGASSDAN